MSTSFTKKQISILDCINHSDTPLSAAQILEKMQNINLATVYRGLKALESAGKIEGFTISCDKEGIVRYYFRYQRDHVHFFHCTNCHCFIPFDSCTLQKELSRFEKEQDCAITGHTMYVTGLCSRCR